MFLFSADTYLRELQTHAPDIAAAAARALDAAKGEGGFLALQRDSFRRCRKESIDYAVMEKTSRAAVVPLAAGLERRRLLGLAARRQRPWTPMAMP